MIDHWKGFELELAEINYQHDRKPSFETISNLKPLNI